MPIIASDCAIRVVFMLIAACPSSVVPSSFRAVRPVRTRFADRRDSTFRTPAADVAGEVVAAVRTMPLCDSPASKAPRQRAEQSEKHGRHPQRYGNDAKSRGIEDEVCAGGEYEFTHAWNVGLATNAGNPPELGPDGVDPVEEEHSPVRDSNVVAPTPQPDRAEKGNRKHGDEQARQDCTGPERRPKCAPAPAFHRGIVPAARRAVTHTPPPKPDR